MRRRIADPRTRDGAAVAAALLGGGCGGSSSDIRLTIALGTVDRVHLELGEQRFELRCNPAGGNDPARRGDLLPARARPEPARPAGDGIDLRREPRHPAWRHRPRGRERPQGRPRLPLRRPRGAYADAGVLVLGGAARRRERLALGLGRLGLVRGVGLALGVRASGSLGLWLRVRLGLGVSLGSSLRLVDGRLSLRLLDGLGLRGGFLGLQGSGVRRLGSGAGSTRRQRDVRLRRGRGPSCRPSRAGSRASRG